MGGAAVFAAGMNSIGLTGELVDLMKASQSAAQIAAAVGPFVSADPETRRRWLSMKQLLRMHTSSE